MAGRKVQLIPAHLQMQQRQEGDEVLHVIKVKEVPLEQVRCRALALAACDACNGAQPLPPRSTTACATGRRVSSTSRRTREAGVDHLSVAARACVRPPLQALDERRLHLEVDAAGRVVKNYALGVSQQHLLFGFDPEVLVGRHLTEFLDVFKPKGALRVPQAVPHGLCACTCRCVRVLWC